MECVKDRKQWQMFIRTDPSSGWSWTGQKKRPASPRDSLFISKCMVCWSLCTFFSFFWPWQNCCYFLCININLCVTCHASLMTIFALVLHVLLASRCHAAFCHQMAFLSFVLFCSFHKPSINMSVVCISILHIWFHVNICKYLKTNSPFCCPNIITLYLIMSYVIFIIFYL